MDIEKLRSFITVAHLGSISAAADELYLSSSAVSKHISALENELGASLFIRNQKRLTLTADGEKCLFRAEIILKEYNQMLSELAESSSICIAAIPAQKMLHYPLHTFEKQHPDIAISVTDLHGPEIIRAIKAGEFELAFTGSTYVDPDIFDLVSITCEPVGCVLAETHPLAGENIISLTQLRSERFYLMSPETGLYDYYRKMCVDNGFEPCVAGVRSREESILKCVEYGGVSFMDASTFLDYSSRKIRLVPLQETYLAGYMIIKLKNRPLSRNAKLLWDFFVEHC